MKSIRFFAGMLALGAAGAGLVLNSGCVVAAAGAAAGAGTVAFVEGKFVSRLSNPYEQVARAASTAVAQMQFAVISVKKDSLSEEIVARNAQDKKITVSVIREADNLSRVEIRVGTFGDKDVSLLIFDKIRADL